MSVSKKILTILNVACLAGISFCFGQQPPAFSVAVERQFHKIETDIVTSAEAMPENQYSFIPDNLHIKNAEFNGVRTFAGQIMHLATDNILIWSAVTGDSVRSDIEDVNGPKNIKSKADIIKYLKGSFETGRKAMLSMTEQNAMDMIEFRGRNLPRLDLVFYALTHSNEHYGQMAVYLRMCGIVPPPTLTDR